MPPPPAHPPFASSSSSTRRWASGSTGQAAAVVVAVAAAALAVSAATAAVSAATVPTGIAVVASAASANTPVKAATTAAAAGATVVVGHRMVGWWGRHGALMVGVVVLRGHASRRAMRWRYRGHHGRHLWLVVAVQHSGVRRHAATATAVTAVPSFPTSFPTSFPSAFPTAVLHPSAVVGGATASELHVRDLMGHLIHVPNLILKKESF